jgi:hypothetical protein
VAQEVYKMCISQMGPEAQVTTAAIVMDRLAGTQVVASCPPATTPSS